MKGGAKGFFLIEVLVALALAAIFSGVFVNFFMQSWSICMRVQKRTEMLSKILVVLEQEKMGSTENDLKNIQTKELLVSADINFKKNIQNICGERVHIPERFVLKEYKTSWNNAEGKQEHITIVSTK